MADTDISDEALKRERASLQDVERERIRWEGRLETRVEDQGVHLTTINGSMDEVAKRLGNIEILMTAAAETQKQMYEHITKMDLESSREVGDLDRRIELLEQGSTRTLATEDAESRITSDAKKTRQWLFGIATVIAVGMLGAWATIVSAVIYFFLSKP